MIGSFLSMQTGSMGVSEKLANSSLNEMFDFRLASRKSSPTARLIEMFLWALFGNYEILHIDVYSGKAFVYADLTSLVGKLRKKRIIQTLHGGALPKYTQARENRVKRVLKRANYIQSPSKYLMNYFNSIGVELKYLPNPIDLREFRYARQAVKPFSILWVRAFTSIYNPDIPVRALKLLLREFPETILTMAGPDKGMQKRVEHLAKELGVANQVNFVGPVSNKELYRYYQTHQVFLNTTSYESFGVAVVEAASCGIPVVSNPVGEIPYLWSDGKNMLFAENNEVSNFVDCVTKIFTDSELRVKLSLEARLKSEQFDWDLIKPQWIHLLANN